MAITSRQAKVSRELGGSHERLQVESEREESDITN
jgi:hypothetical protein